MKYNKLFSQASFIREIIFCQQHIFVTMPLHEILFTFVKTQRELFIHCMI